MFCSIAPVDVVVVLVVTAECNKRTDTEAVREEDLRHCINPHLRRIVFIALIYLFVIRIVRLDSTRLERTSGSRSLVNFGVK